jgi:hypothetical protein
MDFFVGLAFGATILLVWLSLWYFHVFWTLLQCVTPPRGFRRTYNRHFWTYDMTIPQNLHMLHGKASKSRAVGAIFFSFFTTKLSLNWVHCIQSTWASSASNLQTCVTVKRVPSSEAFPICLQLYFLLTQNSPTYLFQVKVLASLWVLLNSHVHKGTLQFPWMRRNHDF